jgi:hypothetical protein
MNTILICKCCSQIFELCHAFKGPILSIFVLCLCPAFWERDTNMYLVLSGFTFRQTSLLASSRACIETRIHIMYLIVKCCDH